MNSKVKGATVLRRPGHPDMIVPSESQEQISIFQWASLYKDKFHELGLLYSVPNGGARRPAEAAIMKAEGVKAGVPDIHLPVSRHCNSLYIELKRRSFALPNSSAARWGTVSEDQLDWLDKLKISGNYAVICRGSDHAKATIRAYLNSDVGRLEQLNSWWVDLPARQLQKVTKAKSRK